MIAATPRNTTAQVLSNRSLNAEIRELVLEMPAEWGTPLPGQFVQVECRPDDPFTLRRPFSVARVRPGRLGVDIHLVYGPIGEGTRALARRRPGETVEVVGPLGSGFRPVPGRRPILVGGGRGVAPLLALADFLVPEHPDGILLFGVRSRTQLYELEDVPYAVQVATQDGSAGFAGTVLDLLDELLGRGEIEAARSALFSCGPNPMLHALSDWASARSLPCQVSLETVFGCGFGICAGCAVPVIPVPGEETDEFGHYRFACLDGPVFEGHRVEWEGVEE